MSRRLFVMVLGMGLGCNLSVYGQQAAPADKGPAGPQPNPPAAPMPAAGVAPNPYLAPLIAQRLRESGLLSQYRINVFAQNGVVDLVGEVADEGQHETVLRLLRTVPGIVTVRDYLQERQSGSVMQTQAVGPIPMPLSAQPAPAPKVPERIDGQLPEPTPIFQAPPGPNPALQPPPMPPYAWPTYAPYNNYSRVAYPNAYAYDQFPFIGPMYPFPKVPLGWRSVSLTWQDGHWWYARNPTGHDWWRIRYH